MATAPFPLTLPGRPADEPAGRWLSRALRGEILAGRLRPGARLPPSRELAGHYGLARGTVVQVFEQLRAEGYLAARVGSGTFVTRVLPDRLLTAPRPVRPAVAERPRPRPLSGYGRRIARFHNMEPGPVRAFRCHQPALDLFPTTLWGALAARRLRQASTHLLLSTPPCGYPPLRQAVAEYLTTARGVHCTPERVAIVSGTQEALDLTARLFLDPGSRVAIEDPGYSGARMAFQGAGARLVPLPVDAEGLVLDRRRLEGVRLVYVTPAHQFPLGVSMSVARRLALLGWARETGALILEDDYDSEYRYAGRPLPALQGLDTGAQVIFTGSFSKVLFPALRLGYLVLPDDLVERYEAAQSLTHRHAAYLEQVVLTDFIAAGHFGRHLRRMREVYAGRLALLAEEVRGRLAGALELGGVEAGLQTAGWLAAGLDADAIAARAARRDVEVTTIGRYRMRAAAAGARDGLLLGFAAVDAAELRRGVRELARAVEG
ncbi:MAG: PLP-dependent aminotransferase family protein [Gemmatimonadetes bacterium]|nr:PLP-dependent aminotransferase family protein [Gemmatimonadota bacterium]MBK9066836.1 PLP-dependent aminotransferase family protein [Gemmatimonadota bacterium]